MPPDLTEPTAKFIAISNVLHGIQNHDHGRWRDADLHAKVASRVVKTGKRPGQLRPMVGDAKRCLRIAWQTELAARVSDIYDDDMLRRVAAQTLPVQAYYAVFNAARATMTAIGMSCETHASVHNDFENQRAKRAYRSWAATMTGDPAKPALCTVAPAGTPPVGFNLMERSHPPEDYLGAALRMTRRWKFEDERERWLRNNKKADGQPRKQLPSAARSQIITKLRPTTMMDFVYELRCRANYEGVDEYGSDADDSDVGRFHRGLLHITDMGMLHYETMIVGCVGLKAYEAEVKQWASSVAKVGKWSTDAVHRRLQAIQSVVT